MRKIICFFLFLFFSLPFGKGWGWAFAQELNCTVRIQNTSKSQTIDPKVYQTLQIALAEFMNNRKWTEDIFESFEKIECTILINIIEEASPEYLKTQVTIQATRPVFKSTYNSVLLNYVDKDFEFEYKHDQPLEFADNTHISNLTSLMAYYAYLIIGLDYDSFSPLGGNPYFLKAQGIVSNAQNAPEPGWKSKKYSDTKNRYWIIENLLNAKYEKYRNAFYKYHRLGLDKMFDNLTEGKKVIIECLNDFSQTNKDNPSSVTIQLLMNAKSDELINIYTQGTPVEKNNAISILSALDPANSQKYRRIQK